MKQTNQDAVPSDQSLQYALHSLLRKRHHQALALPTPRPVTAYPMQGGSKRLCLAGASGLTAAEVAPDLQRFVDVLCASKNKNCVGSHQGVFIIYGGGGGLANGEMEGLELFVPPSMMKDNFFCPPPPPRS